MQLQVVDKSEKRTGALGVNIVAGFCDDFCTEKIRNSGTHGLPCIAGRQRKLEWRNEA